MASEGEGKLVSMARRKRSVWKVKFFVFLEFPRKFYYWNFRRSLQLKRNEFIAKESTSLGRILSCISLHFSLFPFRFYFHSRDVNFSREFSLKNVEASLVLLTSTWGFSYGETREFLITFNCWKNYSVPFFRLVGGFNCFISPLRTKDVFKWFSSSLNGEIMINRFSADESQAGPQCETFFLVGVDEETDREAARNPTD